MGYNEIKNEDLTVRDLPGPNADYDAIIEFALSFNGYDYWESFEKCAEVSNSCLEQWEEDKSLPTSLAELRTCVFFEQRRWHHFGEIPNRETMEYIHQLIEAIRAKVLAGDYD